MTTPIAGWYPDPQDDTRFRWWDGARWGDLAPEPAARVPVPQAESVESPRPPAPSEYRDGDPGADAVLRGRAARVAKDRATRAANPFGYAGLVLALVAFLLNVFAVPGLLGLVFGAIGLARAAQLTGAKTTGFGVSLAAVILGLVATGVFAVRLTQVLG